MLNITCLNSTQGDFWARLDALTTWESDAQADVVDTVQ